MRLKHLISCFILATLALLTSAQEPFTVVIDPGHGGKDTGCVGKLTNEKSIVLDVATRLGKMIAANHPDVKIVFTRNDDRFIELNERARIANKANANLFISIHVNSIDLRTKGRENVHGASVYTLGLHRNDDNLAVAMRENSVIELENDFSENYQGFDPSSSESYIIFELTQNMHLRQSIDFAESAQRELISTAGRADKEVRQSGFLVLRATSMPAVLVELDFICNPAAEKFLASDEGREKCALSISNAFTNYYTRNTQGAKSRETKVQSSDNPSDNDAVYYAIQILCSGASLPQGSSHLKGHDQAKATKYNGKWIFVEGEFKSLKDAKKAIGNIKVDFPDAFIVKMKGGNRI